MAKVRSGNTGFAVALVIFGCSFVIATLVAIILYTKIETHKAAEAEAKADRAKYVSTSETGQANEYVSEGGTVFAVMRDKIAKLEAAVRDAQTEIAKQQAAASKMESDFNLERSAKQDLDRARKAESDQYATIMTERQSQLDALNQEKDALVTQIGDLQAKVTSAIKNSDEAAQQRIEELNASITTLDQEKQELDGQIVRLNFTIDELRKRLPKLPEPNTTLPDGQIASVIGEGKEVLVDLGRADGLVIGMTFEVFDPQPVIRLNTADEARGKATVEVYALDNDTAVCRIVRAERGNAVSPGDTIVNVAYEPNMDIAMYAFGTFDIERDGGTNDVDRIKALILKSGASIPELKIGNDGIPVLTPDLDYIVLGEKPDFPDKPGADVIDPEIIREYQAKLAENEAYYRIIDDAKLMRIPILSQNRFLQLTGYYVR